MLFLPDFSVSPLSLAIVSTASPTCSVCRRTAWAAPLVFLCGPGSCSRCWAGATHGRNSVRAALPVASSWGDAGSLSSCHGVAGRCSHLGCSLPSGRSAPLASLWRPTHFRVRPSRPRPRSCPLPPPRFSLWCLSQALGTLGPQLRPRAWGPCPWQACWCLSLQRGGRGGVFPRPSSRFSPRKSPGDGPTARPGQADSTEASHTPGALVLSTYTHSA